MKIEFDLKELDNVPKDWPNDKNWPGNGAYVCKDEPTTLYIVGNYSVSYVMNAFEVCRKIESPSGDAIPEALVLRLIAAAARAEVLK